MTSIFEADSPLMRFLSRIADVMILNLVFVATSIPLVTLGASLTALNYTALKLVAGDCDSVTRSYLHSFRSNFKQATAVLAVVAVLGAVLVAWFVVAEYAEIPSVLRFFLYLILFVLAFRFSIAVIYVFPYLAKFEGSTREVLRNASKMSLRHVFSSIAMLLTTGLPIVITVFYPELTAYGILWLGIGFAAIAFVNAYLVTAIFDKYILASSADPA